MWRENGQPQADYTDVLELDLGTVEPSLAGPKRPQDRVPLRTAKQTLPDDAQEDGRRAHRQESDRDAAPRPRPCDGKSFEVADGAVLIAAITSCTNTSNPAVLIGAGLLARNARKRGLTSKPWVKTSLAPGSRVVTDYLDKAGLLRRSRSRRLLHRRLRLHDVHRQLRSAASRRSPRPCAPAIVDRLLGALRQPQLRRPRASGSEDELPRLAAAGRRVRARRHAESRSHDRAARRGQRRQAGLPQGHLADAGARSTSSSPSRSTRRCSRRATPACSPATSTGTRSACRAARSTRGTTSPPT